MAPSVALIITASAHLRLLVEEPQDVGAAGLHLLLLVSHRRLLQGVGGAQVWRRRCGSGGVAAAELAQLRGTLGGEPRPSRHPGAGLHAPSLALGAIPATQTAGCSQLRSGWATPRPSTRGTMRGGAFDRRGAAPGRRSRTGQGAWRAVWPRERLPRPQLRRAVSWDNWAGVQSTSKRGCMGLHSMAGQRASPHSRPARRFCTRPPPPRATQRVHRRDSSTTWPLSRAR